MRPTGEKERSVVPGESSGRSKPASGVPEKDGVGQCQTGALERLPDIGMKRPLVKRALAGKESPQAVKKGWKAEAESTRQLERKWR